MNFFEVAKGDKHANELVPLIFIEQLPQIPSLQDRLKDNVESWVDFICIKASKTIGPHSFIVKG